ncbi:MAG: YkvA family protein [Acidobacteriota bacterium]|nr:YkvA family protein [Acidobacteriota bacterium]
MSDLQPTNDAKLTRREKSESKSKLKNALLFLPNMVKLLGRMMTDGRVPLAEKALFVGAIVYVISPFDLIPDIFPFIGQVDDLYVVALVLLRLINRTDEAVVRENWDGGGDIVSLAKTIANLAPRLLPKRVSRVLSAEIQLAPAAENLTHLIKSKQTLISEFPTPETEKTKMAAK